MARRSMPPPVISGVASPSARRLTMIYHFMAWLVDANIIASKNINMVNKKYTNHHLLKITLLKTMHCNMMMMTIKS